MSDDRTADLAARAAHRHVVVIGGGIGGLVAARECAKVGMQVTVLESEGELGGAIRRADLGGLTVDAGAESYATRGGHVRALLDELGLGDRIVTPNPAGAWLVGAPGVDAAPLPKGGILGIPVNPFADDVRRIIGWGGAWRAYVDRLRPPLTIGQERSLGTLVARRMGPKVRDMLVAPVTAGVYSADPDDVDTEIAAPGLNAALTRAGSLSGGVAQLIAERADRAAKAPGSAVEGVAGGMSALVDALQADLQELGAVVRTGVPVTALSRAGDGWTVSIASVAADKDEEPVEESITADAVFVATPEPGARTLLDGLVPGLGDPGEAPQIEIVSLLLEAPVLDAQPRGTGVLTVPGSRTAKALTHATAKWSWLREAAGTRHVVRVSFGAQGEPAATAGLDDDAAARLALTEAEGMLGVPLPESALIASHRARFTQSQPSSLIGAADRRREVRKALQKVDGLAVVGAWLAGTGLAQVVPDAKAEADRLRRALLWGDDAPLSTP
ncbi:oxygen-dependent protoporphyrinogen oxidase [Microbacterium ginsengiterrae]|uniref:Coproporphyrinogen III oxidase n=1 Tax=Microbacterium ginsengiterrae TaxID=546115 RepID=A0A7W9CBA8_9MICO|nr:protoporphyrinogen oxidase [Microbacterium ginsengiterrae]MBB5742447.1 oxygen-dependent protoporphyrinogen oxidase [Microbacterium ginsengiterrae]